MKNTTTEPQTPVTVTRCAGGRFVVEGELHQANAADFERTFSALEPDQDETLVLDLAGFDLSDGVAVATTINVLRDLLGRVGRLKLVSAPQMLGHNLYRVGLLGSGDKIELIAMREEEPYG